MIRSELKRTGFARKLPTEAKPAKIKTRKCPNRECRKPFMGFGIGNACSIDCAHAVAMARLAKQKAKAARADRVATKQAKDDNMRHQDRLELVQKLINRCAVLRDWEDGCISCDKGPNWDGIWHGSHYKSVGSNSALRYNLFNINKSCSQCNWFRAGSIATYEPRLVIKWGSERAEWIKNHPRSKEYTTEYLKRLAEVARKWIKRREKRLGIR